MWSERAPRHARDSFLPRAVSGVRLASSPQAESGRSASADRAVTAPAPEMQRSLMGRHLGIATHTRQRSSLRSRPHHRQAGESHNAVSTPFLPRYDATSSSEPVPAPSLPLPRAVCHLISRTVPALRNDTTRRRIQWPDGGTCILHPHTLGVLQALQAPAPAEVCTMTYVMLGGNRQPIHAAT